MRESQLRDSLGNDLLLEGSRRFDWMNFDSSSGWGWSIIV